MTIPVKKKVVEPTFNLEQTRLGRNITVFSKFR